jgi:hypothetical protein
MGYFCRVEEDTIGCTMNCEDNRATTFVITFPRIVLAEVVTHRVNADGGWGEEFSVCERTTTPDISKNSASSRAIPHKKMIERIESNPFMPFWTSNQSGMQGKQVTDEETVSKANASWLRARNFCLEEAGYLSNTLNIHKGDTNRLLEPWMWVTQVVTSSRWDNFFALRCHKAAHPAFARIARMMFLARRKSTPRRIEYGQWHLPFIPPEEKKEFRWVPEVGKVLWPHENDPPFELPLLLRKSAARCAWVSYENHDKQADDEAHLKTWERLFTEVPVHASPVEHQLTPMHPAWSTQPRLRSNITGFLQARKLIRHEEIKEYNPSEEEIASWGIEG